MRSFDLRNTLGPFSILEVVNHFTRMELDEEMEIICDDAEIYKDIKSILPASTYRFVSEESEMPDEGDFRVKLRKIKSTLKPKGGRSCLKI
jgi:TusA-related sulfurtransferase